jgi:hypothetical protein
MRAGWVVVFAVALAGSPAAIADNSKDGRNQRVTGTACRDPNGTWRNVR